MKQIGSKKSWIICAVTAAVLLAICSKCSFLYPLNDWVDANIYFTMGKGMLSGRVLYRDIYDHKGPFLYFIHGLAILISNRSFLGIYLMEIVAFAWFLTAAWKILRLYCTDVAIWAIPVLAAVILSSNAFCHGDSAEEFCIPLIMWSLYVTLRYFKKEYPQPMAYKTLFIHGMLAGCILWVKYTMLGFHFAWMAMIFCSCLIRKDWKRSVVSCMVFLLGMTVTVVPCLLYFGMNHAMLDFLKVYFYDNIFVYGSKEPIQLFNVAKSLIKNVLDAFVANWKFSPFIIGGILWYVISHRQSILEKINVLMLLVFTTLGVCWGVVQWQPYYALVFSVFAVFGMIPVIRFVEQWFKEKEMPLVSVAGVVLAAGMIFCYFTGNYTDQIGRSKKDIVQYQFAEYIAETEDATLLNYGFLDGGFYTVCGITPQFKYFSRINMQIPELHEEQEDIVRNGKVDYVVTRGFELMGEQLTHYEEIAEADAWYEGILYTYYLYRHIENY